VLKDFRNKLVFVSGKYYQPTLRFVGKARSLPLNGAIQVLHLGRLQPYSRYKLERLAIGQHSNLLQTFVNYGRKKFYDIGHFSQDYEKKYYMSKVD
jgi:hypothetical protein